MKEEDQEGVCNPNFEIDYGNGETDGLDSKYENDNEMTEYMILQRLWILKM